MYWGFPDSQYRAKRDILTIDWLTHKTAMYPQSAHGRVEGLSTRNRDSVRIDLQKSQTKMPTKFFGGRLAIGNYSGTIVVTVLSCVDRIPDTHPASIIGLKSLVIEAKWTIIAGKSLISSRSENP